MRRGERGRGERIGEGKEAEQCILNTQRRGMERGKVVH